RSSPTRTAPTPGATGRPRSGGRTGCTENAAARDDRAPCPAPEPVDEDRSRGAGPVRAWRCAMGGKEMEGGNRQRRQKAREARRRGRLPGEEGVTTGASKQRDHLAVDEDHALKVETIRQGKQDVIRENTPAVRPRSRPPVR